MSLQTADQPANFDSDDSAAVAAQTPRGSQLKVGRDAEQWDKLRAAVEARAEKLPASEVFGAAGSGGAIYRWGAAVSSGGSCDELLVTLSRLAVEGAVKPKSSVELDLVAAAEEFIDSCGGPMPTVREASVATIWAAAMPALCRQLSDRVWWDLLGALQQLRERAMAGGTDSPLHLMLAGELGLTLAWRLADLPSCKRLARPAAESIDHWFKGEEESLAAAVEGFVDARLVLASLIRSRRIIAKTTKRKFKKRQLALSGELATWVAAMTTHDGRSAFSTSTRSDVRDDLAKTGLLRTSVEFDPEVLGPAVSAALAESRSGGRLAWQVCLPEAMLHYEQARAAVMLPDWDVRRGRTHLDYSSENVRIELFGGRSCLFGGDWQVMIEVAEQTQHPCGDWSNTCEYSDDDVHYLELEQPWTGDLVLQRQVLVIREDRCVLLADSIVSDELEVSGAATGKPSANNHAPEPRSISYTSRFPLAAGLSVEFEEETTDAYLCDAKRRALVLPLAAGEWRVGPSPATLQASPDDCLVYQVQGAGCLYAPLWLDLQSRRFNRKRTWRQLTVGDELRVVGRHEAVGYRVQTGSEQWMIYRSLGEPRCRTVMGKHLLADFLCTRFEMGDGTHDELVTVDAADGDE